MANHGAILLGVCPGCGGPLIGHPTACDPMAHMRYQMSLPDALAEDAREAGAAEERARIVAWLRYGVLHAVCTGTASPIEVIRTVLIRLADAIERGAHLEPKP